MLKQVRTISGYGLLGLAITIVSSSFSPAQETGQKTFPSCADAGKALYEAVQANDKTTMLAILGSSANKVVESGDSVQDQNNRKTFLEKYGQMNRCARDADGSKTLYIGADNWPFPFPMFDKGHGWYFDSVAGSEEILYRRIGKNELTTIRVMEELNNAQHEYFDNLYDGGTVHQYAGKWFSDPGKHNGLYWPAVEGQPESPVGPLVAYGAAEGYGSSKSDKPQPFHGYFYRILKEQGASAAGGAKSYFVNGNMTVGFAFLAYPADYKNSGVMTFMIDQNGAVYQKDLGTDTGNLAKAITAFNPDKSWTAVSDEDDPEDVAEN